MFGRFVIHEHQGRRRHYDLRLEIDGVLKSWAIPRGPSMNPDERRLAIMVTDHPLAYADFEGIIPAGESEAGPVIIWDRGTFATIGTEAALTQLRRGRFTFALRGDKIQGAFALVHMRRGSGTDWLLIKRKDQHAHAGWRITSELTPRRRRALVERLPHDASPRPRPAPWRQDELDDVRRHA